MSQPSNEKTVDQEIKRAAQLSLVEISLGSVGHGLKIPLTGQLLSLNQLAFLLNAINRDQLPTSSAFEISGIASLLKSFSPAGQKLGPMLAIAMQGFLFWFFIGLLGRRFVGQSLGAIALALWAFIQPLLTLVLIFGTNLSAVFSYYQNKISDDFAIFKTSILVAALLVIGLKIFIAVGMTAFSIFTRKELVILKKNTNYGRPTEVKNVSTLRGVLRDLTRPLFLFSFALTIVFIWKFDATLSQKIWMSLRPLAVAFIVFYALRSPITKKGVSTLAKRSASFNRIYQKAAKAYASLFVENQKL